MEFEFNDSGFDEFKNEFEKKKKEAEGKVTLDQLLTSSFMEKHTGYKDLDSFAADSDIDFTDPKEAVESEEWDSYVRKNSSFSGWEEMFAAAGQSYMKEKLEFE